MSVTPLIEAIKEPLRYLLMAVVSYLLTEGVLNTILIRVFGTQLDATAVALITGLLIAVLRGIDKYLHEVGLIKEEATGLTSSLTKGLTRF